MSAPSWSVDELREALGDMHELGNSESDTVDTFIDLLAAAAEASSPAHRVRTMDEVRRHWNENGIPGFVTMQRDPVDPWTILISWPSDRDAEVWRK